MTPRPLPAGSLRPAPATPVRGSQFDRAQALATLSVIVLAATLMIAPPLLALISIVFASRLEGFAFQPVLPVYIAPMVEWGRVLLALALVTQVVRTRETA